MGEQAVRRIMERVQRSGGDPAVSSGVDAQKTTITILPLSPDLFGVFFEDLNSQQIAYATADKIAGP